MNSTLYIFNTPSTLPPYLSLSPAFCLSLPSPSLSLSLSLLPSLSLSRSHPLAVSPSLSVSPFSFCLPPLSMSPSLFVSLTLSPLSFLVSLSPFLLPSLSYLSEFSPPMILRWRVCMRRRPQTKSTGSKPDSRGQPLVCVCACACVCLGGWLVMGNPYLRAQVEVIRLLN